MRAHACGTILDDPTPLETKVSSWLEWLANPAAQVVHPRGPPEESNAGTAEAMNQMSSAFIRGSRPSRKVLKRAPCGPHAASYVPVRISGGLTGELLCDAELPEDSRVADLKELLSQREGTPSAQQRFLHENRVLSDRESISDILEEGELKCQLVFLRIDPQRAELLRKLESGSLNLWDLPREIQCDPECALAAVRRSPLVVNLAAEELRGHRNFMLAAARIRGSVLEYASAALRGDRAVVLAAVSEDGLALEFAAAELRGAPDVVLAAVERSGMALQFASAELRADRAVVLAAVEESGCALEYAAHAMRADQEVVLVALRRNQDALRHVAAELFLDPSFRSVLDGMGLLDDSFLELLDDLLWIGPDAANEMQQTGSAVFLDARSASDFRASRIAGAHSLPFDTTDQYTLEKHSARCLILERSELTMIVYSDIGSPTCPDNVIASLLRTYPGVQVQRVLRLSGGLSSWSSAGLPVQVFGYLGDKWVSCTDW